MTILSCCKQHFDSASADYRFLTFRGPDAKHQSINFVEKMCKAVSRTYLIVREKNKRTDGYHFHALLRVDFPVPKSFFKKGCHVNLQLVGRAGRRSGMPPPPTTITSKDVDLMYECTENKEEAKSQHVDVIVEKLHKACAKASRIRESVSRVVDYMAKELEMPCQFTDYIYVVSGKHQCIDN